MINLTGIGILYSLVALGFAKDIDGPNRFGEDTLAIDEMTDEG